MGSDVRDGDFRRRQLFGRGEGANILRGGGLEASRSTLDVARDMVSCPFSVKEAPDVSHVTL